MSWKPNWLSKILPSPIVSIEQGEDANKSYKKFSRGLSIILMVLVLVPLTIVSILAHYQYEQLLQKEEMQQLILNLEEARGQVEEFVSELESIIKFVARHDRYEELLDEKELEKLFVRLQNAYPGVADIEVIDFEGKQKSYVGPYKLEGHNYVNQTWYKEVLQHGIYISNVFMGFRNVPHFVIAVSRQHEGRNGNWVLRVTIDGKTLQKFVETISTTYADDIFLIDADNITRTQPHKYGNIGEKCYFYNIGEATEESLQKIINKLEAINQDMSTMKIIQKDLHGNKVVQAVIDLENAPWKLVLIKEQYLYADSWRQFKIRLVTIFLSCVIVAVLVIFEISDMITNHLRVGREKWLAIHTKAEQAGKLASIGRLAAGVAHEINNPLAIINQKAGLVQDFVEMSEDFKHKGAMEDALDGIQGSVERCKKITHRLLGFARQADLQSDEIDVNVTLREVVDFLAKEATYNQIRIEFELDENLKTIFSDKGQLQQIFLNITNNAIDAIGSNGSIVLKTRQLDSETVRISIIDDGPGMPADVKKRIFEPFFTTKETGKGTGLGLSISYGIIQKLGGNINVISQEGEGTTFEIDLPLVQQS